MRHEIERVLDDLLYRPRDVADRIEAGENGPGLDLLRQALADTGDMDLIVVVSATPVADTGRDHDYDWAIWEPNDVRSAPQTAGRVFRHREGIPESEGANFAMLRRNWRSLVRGAPKPYRHPGPETALTPPTADRSSRAGKFRVTDYTGAATGGDAGDFANVGPVERFGDRVDGVPAFSEADHGALAALEHDRMRWLLEARDGDAALDGLYGYIRRATVRGTDYHVRASPFRGGEGRSVEFCLRGLRDLGNTPWDWRVRSPRQGLTDFSQRADIQTEPALRNWHRVLLSLDPDTLVTELAQHLGGDTNARVQELTSIQLPCEAGEPANRVRLRFESTLGGVKSSEKFPYLSY
jgi:hypothetical protein